MAPTQTQSTRFLVISDTHDNWPYTPETPPKADVLLHCGDLTQVGGLASFKRAMSHIKSVDAELKLVIAGNHDLELDETWVRQNADEENSDVEEELADSRRCVEYMKSLEEFGVHYLEEGVHDFTLKSGAGFRVYASPYTPEFNGYAFAYGRDEDRFNGGPEPMPDGVDIVMTHGPPLLLDEGYQLDADGKGKHLGCGKLMEAVQRVKPRLHCFGHIHEGRGAAKLSWDSETGGIKSVEAMAQEPVLCAKNSEATVLLNAAINQEGDEGIMVELGSSR